MMVGYFSGNLARDQLEAGRIGPSLENIERSLRILAEYVEPDSYTYAAGLYTRGSALLAARRVSEALPVLTSSLERLEKALGPEHERTHAARVRRSLALAYSGRSSEASQLLEALIARRRAAGQAALVQPLHALGVLQRLTGDRETALRLQQESLASIPDGPRAGLERIPVLVEVGLNQVELGRQDGALTALQEALALMKAVQMPPSPVRADALVGMGRVKMAQGVGAEAFPMLEEADRFWRELGGESRWTGEAALWLGRCYLALDRPAESKQALARAERILSRSPIPSDARLVKLARAR
jgi:tetratricopeptide (TPR) repeat protein